MLYEERTGTHGQEKWKGNLKLWKSNEGTGKVDSHRAWSLLKWKRRIFVYKTIKYYEHKSNQVDKINETKRKYMNMKNIYMNKL